MDGQTVGWTDIRMDIGQSDNQMDGEMVGWTNITMVIRSQTIRWMDRRSGRWTDIWIFRPCRPVVGTCNSGQFRCPTRVRSWTYLVHNICITDWPPLAGLSIVMASTIINMPMTRSFTLPSSNHPKTTSNASNLAPPTFNTGSRRTIFSWTRTNRRFATSVRDRSCLERLLPLTVTVADRQLAHYGVRQTKDTRRATRRCSHIRGVCQQHRESMQLPHVGSAPHLPLNILWCC